MRKLLARETALRMAATAVGELGLGQIAPVLGKEAGSGERDPDCHLVNAELHRIRSTLLAHAIRLSKD